jgi:alpha-mannosidase
MNDYKIEGEPSPFSFVVSQSIQMKWLKEDHPHLFSRVQAAVKAGLFVPVGGTVRDALGAYKHACNVN